MISRSICALGLALLYASAYVLPLITKFSIYFVSDYLAFLILPTIVVVLIVTPLLLFGKKIAARYSASSWVPRLKLFVISVFILIAVKCCMDAAGFSWLKLVSWTSVLFGLDTSVPSRTLRVLFVIVTLLVSIGVVMRLLHKINELLRFLACLGFSFTILAVYRCAFQFGIETHSPPSTSAQAANEVFSSDKQKQVVWIIFDELDSKLSLLDPVAMEHLPNFGRIATQGITANNAAAPGRDTLYSIPSLLMGVPFSGWRVRRQSRLEIETVTGEHVPFDWDHTIFGKISKAGRKSAVIGYYHPYCSALPELAYCRTNHLGNAGRWFDGLLFFSEALFTAGRHFPGFLDVMPDDLLRLFDPMYRITTELQQAAPELIGKNEYALIFVHVNMPHLPASYAKRQNGSVSTSTTELEDYAANVVAADKFLGSVLSEIDRRENSDVLLVVSSDHWLRTQSFTPRPIPLLIWHNREKLPANLTMSVSTVYTSDFIEAYLSGQFAADTELSQWWTRKSAMTRSQP
jgi:hypothetical protein